MTQNRQSLETFQERVRGVLAAQGASLPWPQSTFGRAAKRALDILGALSLLLLASPVMAATALAVRLTSPGPVLFRQQRLGKDAVPYQMLKFRSMAALRADGSAGFSGEVTATDARLTPIGAFIRAWRIDELPQLLHVLSGRMSFVGPRPDIPESVDLLTDDQLLRFAMPPGCTAWTFTRGAFRNDWSERQDIHVEYVRQWSFWLDIKILFGSAFVLFFRQDEANPSYAAVREAPSLPAQNDVR